MVLEGILTWLSNVPATIWGSLIVGAMTLLGVILGQYLIYRRDRQKQEEEIVGLRKALTIELQTIDEWLEWVLYASHDLERLRDHAYALSDEQYEETFETDLQAHLTMYVIAHNRVPESMEVYAANADKIGKLDPDVAEHVIRTQRTLENLYRSLRSVGNELAHDDLMLNDEVDWSTGAGLSGTVIVEMKQVESGVLEAFITQKVTLAKLGHELSKHERSLIAFALNHMDPRSEEEENRQQSISRYMEEHELSFEELVDEEADHPLQQKES